MEIAGFSFDKLKEQYEGWVAQQHPAVQVLLTGLTSASSGVAIGYLLGSLSPPTDQALPDGANPAISAQLKALQGGGPWAQARNLGVLTGVNAAASAALKRARKGKEDVYSAMGASFCSGVAYSLVSGAPNPIQAAITTGIAFAAFNGLFYQIGQMFKPTHADTEYERAKYMLATLGLQKYADNLKKSLLTDNTIMLWNDNALSEARIPAGPRLLILHHLDTYRNPAAAVLKPALPLPPLPPPQAQAAAQAGSSLQLQPSVVSAAQKQWSEHHQLSDPASVICCQQRPQQGAVQHCNEHAINAASSMHCQEEVRNNDAPDVLSDHSTGWPI